MTAQKILWQKIKIKADILFEYALWKNQTVSHGNNPYSFFWGNDYAIHNLIEKHKSTVNHVQVFSPILRHQEYILGHSFLGATA